MNGFVFLGLVAIILSSSNVFLHSLINTDFVDHSTISFHWIISENDVNFSAGIPKLDSVQWSCKPHDTFFYNTLEIAPKSYIYLTDRAEYTIEKLDECLGNRSDQSQQTNRNNNFRSQNRNIIIDLTGTKIVYMYEGRRLVAQNSIYNVKQTILNRILNGGDPAEIFLNYSKSTNDSPSNLLFYYDDKRFMNGVKHVLHLLNGYSASNSQFSWLKLLKKSFLSLPSSALCSNFSTITPNTPIYSYLLLSDEEMINKTISCFETPIKSKPSNLLNWDWNWNWRRNPQKINDPVMTMNHRQKSINKNINRLLILQRVVSYGKVLHYKNYVNINIDYLNDVIGKIGRKNQPAFNNFNSVDLYNRVFLVSVIQHRIDTITSYFFNNLDATERNNNNTRSIDEIDFDKYFKLFDRHDVQLWNRITINSQFNNKNKLKDINKGYNGVKTFFKNLFQNKRPINKNHCEINRTKANDFIIADDLQPYFSIEKSIFSKDQFIKTFILGSILYTVFMGLVFISVYSYYKCYMVKRYYTHSFWKLDKKAIEFENSISTTKNNETIFYDDILDIFCRKPYTMRDIPKELRLRDNVRFGSYAGKSIVIQEKCCMKKNILDFVKMSKYLSNLKQLSHNNFVTFVGSYVEPHKICMVYHRSRYGPLYDVLIEDKKNLDFIFLCSLINDLLNGMTFLHSSLFHYHGKLTSKCCYVEEPWCLKISDYGMRKIETFTFGSSSSDTRSSSLTDYSDFQFRCEDYSNVSFNSVNNKVAFRDVDTVFLSTPTNNSPYCCNGRICECLQSLWSAPELMTTLHSKNNYKNRYQKADIYSFGVILQEMITLNGPFNYNTKKNACKIISKLMQSYRQKKLHSKHPFQVVNDTEGMQHFIPIMKLCLCFNPDRRPSFLKLQFLIKSPLSKNGIKPNIFDNIMNLLTIHSKKLNNLIGEKSGQLLKDKKKAEQLLCRMFPKPIISYLIRGLPVEPELFDQVTIYFSDIVGFTSLCSNISPFQVSQILHELYTQFDEIVALYNVFKVETIGDAYMAVSGLPVRKGGRHATEVCEMALNILNAVENFSIEKLGIPLDNQFKLKIRIGIHTGPVAAGIVGDTMPRYCLFGESVSIAQKMEQFGTPQCVLISQSSLDLIENISNYNITPHKVLKFESFESKTYLISGYKESSSNSGQWWKHTQSNDTIPEPYSNSTFTHETSIDLNSDNLSSRNTSTIGDDIFSKMSSTSYL